MHELGTRHLFNCWMILNDVRKLSVFVRSCLKLYSCSSRSWWRFIVLQWLGCVMCWGCSRGSLNSWMIANVCISAEDQEMLNRMITVYLWISVHVWVSEVAWCWSLDDAGCLNSSTTSHDCLTMPQKFWWLHMALLLSRQCSMRFEELSTYV